mgnify:CR=1 FL=1
MGTSNIFVNAMKTYQQLMPDLQLRKGRKSAVTPQTKAFANANTVGKLLSPLQPMPEKSLLLGQCTDGLPFLLGLVDPEMGAVLIGCEEGCGKTHQMQVMVDSALRTNAPHSLQISVLTYNPQEWAYLREDKDTKKYLRGIHAWYDNRAEETIQELTELAEARRHGQRSGAQVLFILDDFNFVEELSYEAQVNLHWLLAYGAQSDIWLVGSLNAQHASGFIYWIERFRTRVVGRVGSQAAAEILSLREDSQVYGLLPGEFKVHTGTDWLTYRLPLLGD